MIHQVVKGARNLQRESYAILKRTENRFFVLLGTDLALIWMISSLVTDGNREAIFPELLGGK